MCCGGSYGRTSDDRAPDEGIKARVDSDGEVRATSTPDAASDEAGPTCGTTKALCTSACPRATCLSGSHVAEIGTYTRAAGLGLMTITTAAVGDTTTGALGIRTANLNASVYEVRDGIGFIRLIQAPSGVALAIWVAQSVSVGAVVAFSGSASVALVSASSFTVTSRGRVNVSAAGLVAGPGGSTGGGFRTKGNGCGAGGAPTGTGTSGDTGGTNGGGGGGGFGTNGGGGGSATGGPGAGGTAAGCNAVSLRSELFGGSGGAGADNSGTVLGPFGGGGGGAIQLTAMGELWVDGAVSAGGGGGRTAEGNGRNGAGGGSGGAIYLESPAITIGTTGGLFTNGGGGGSASSGTGIACVGPLAASGSATLTPAAGSTCAHGYGGAGSAAATAAEVAESGTGAGGGGGGGGLGRIVLRTRASATPSILSSSLSPAENNATAFSIDKTLD